VKGGKARALFLRLFFVSVEEKIGKKSIFLRFFGVEKRGKDCARARARARKSARARALDFLHAIALHLGNVVKLGCSWGAIRV